VSYNPQTGQWINDGQGVPPPSYYPGGYNNPSGGGQGYNDGTGYGYPNDPRYTQGGYGYPAPPNAGYPSSPGSDALYAPGYGPQGAFTGLPSTSTQGGQMPAYNGDPNAWIAASLPVASQIRGGMPNSDQSYWANLVPDFQQRYGSGWQQEMFARMQGKGASGADAAQQGPYSAASGYNYQPSASEMGMGGMGSLQDYLKMFQYPGYTPSQGAFSYGQPAPQFSPFQYGQSVPTIQPFSYGQAVPTFDQFSYQPLVTPTAATEENDPGYQFRLNEGVKALEASASARGTLNSGNTLQDVLKYGQDYASNEFQNVYQRALTGQGQQFQEALGAYGQNASTQLGQQQQGYSQAANTWGQNAATALQQQQQGYAQAANTYGQNVSTQLQAQQQGFTQALNAYTTNDQRDLQQYLTNYGTYTGLAGLGLNAYSTVGNMGLGYGNLANSQGYLGLAQQAQPFNQLYQLASLGQGSANQVGGYGVDYANQYGGNANAYGNAAANAYTGAGNATAAGQAGAASAYAGGIAGLGQNALNLGIYGAYYGNQQRQGSQAQPPGGRPNAPQTPTYGGGPTYNPYSPYRPPGPVPGPLG
jgi:hypothetical protein